MSYDLEKSVQSACLKVAASCTLMGGGGRESNGVS